MGPASSAVGIKIFHSGLMAVIMKPPTEIDMAGKKKINVVIFDMDGVLVDSEPVIQSAAITTLSEYGVRAHPEDFLPFVGTGDGPYIGGVAEKYGLEYEENMKDRLYEIYFKSLDRMRTFEDVIPLLERLKANEYALAVASSADRIKIEANLEAAGISEGFFDVIIAGEDVSEKKPSPEIYLEASDRLGVSPRECLVVEDALNGVAAAKAAGMACAGVTTSFSESDLLESGADYVCGSAGEVYGVLDKLNG